MLDRAGRDPVCGRFAVARVVGLRYEAFPAKCGKWGCSTCGRERYAWFVRQLEGAVVRYGLRYFWTLTLSTELVAVERSGEVIQRAWERVRADWCDRGWHVLFIWVRELTQAGMVHMHVLVNRRIEHADMSVTWKRATGGSYVVWVEWVRDVEAVSYLAKYAVKDAVLRRIEPGLAGMIGRCYGRARGIEFESFRGKGSSEWRWTGKRYGAVAALAVEQFDGELESREERSSLSARVKTVDLGGRLMSSAPDGLDWGTELEGV